MTKIKRFLIQIFDQIKTRKTEKLSLHIFIKIETFPLAKLVTW